MRWGDDALERAPRARVERRETLSQTHGAWEPVCWGKRASSSPAASIEHMY